MIETLVPWYETNGRSLPWREDTNPYHVWVSEIMLQQTRIEAVIPYYQRFLKELPDVQALAEAEPDRLQKLWEGLGYYSRVRNLQKAAQQIMEQYEGKFPDSYESIRALSGIGDYTAGAIGSICFNLPTPAVDGNVLRVIARITEDGRPVNTEKIKKDVRMELEPFYPKKKAGACTQAIMELGETICLPNGAPDCENCPCKKFCGSSKGEWVNYPVKEAKKSRKTEQHTVFLLRCGDFIALRKRPETGLLAGQWEFPNLERYLSEEEVRKQAKDWGCQPKDCKEEGLQKHVFSHIEWDMKCYSVTCKKKSKEFVWVNSGQLENEISLPTAFRKILK
ncbi:MAG: A/G-specific adenine glycosylase [Lachnospiraceae bacterium]|nr:A/G-specific adenine glycosylase [Lachnospiraceae bacterium]